jgi:Winged helix DNA-binding domain
LHETVPSPLDVALTDGPRPLARRRRPLRLASLLLDAAAGPVPTPLGVVDSFLAMQAQDAPGVAFSLGLRTGLREDAISAALDSREIVRTWPMRGSLPLVPSRDAKWMLALMGDRTLKGAAHRRTIIGLPDDVAHRAVDVLADAVSHAPGPVTRTDCAAAVASAGIGGKNNWTYHLLWFASALGHLADGPQQGKEQTFVSLDAWARPSTRPRPTRRSPSLRRLM